jgi:hypothetical protein
MTFGVTNRMATGINPVIAGHDAHTPHKWFADQAKPPMPSIAPPDEEQYTVLADNRGQFLGHFLFLPLCNPRVLVPGRDTFIHL